MIANLGSKRPLSADGVAFDERSALRAERVHVGLNRKARRLGEA
jgi:hypothetical protein